MSRYCFVLLAGLAAAAPVERGHLGRLHVRRAVQGLRVGGPRAGPGPRLPRRQQHPAARQHLQRPRVLRMHQRHRRQVLSQPGRGNRRRGAHGHLALHRRQERDHLRPVRSAHLRGGPPLGPGQRPRRLQRHARRPGLRPNQAVGHPDRRRHHHLLRRPAHSHRSQEREQLRPDRGRAGQDAGRPDGLPADGQAARRRAGRQMVHGRLAQDEQPGDPANPRAR